MNENTPLNLNPQLGERWVTVNPCLDGKWAVHERLFKANTLRGDAYWVTKTFKTFAKEADAWRLANRLR